MENAKGQKANAKAKCKMQNAKCKMQNAIAKSQLQNGKWQSTIRSNVPVQFRRLFFYIS